MALGHSIVEGWHRVSVPNKLLVKEFWALTSNKEGKVICEIDGWVLAGMQIWVLVRVLFWCAGDGAWRMFARLTAGRYRHVI